MHKYKWGVIGTGKIAHTFATALAHCENAELCAVASRTDDKAKKKSPRNSASEASTAAIRTLPRTAMRR
jgi:predicted dehydrogenase